jgi:phosphate transport system substrate-binding protein
MKKMLCAVLLILTLAVNCLAGPSGRLKIAGSTTVLPIAQIWLEEFMKKHPNVDGSVSGGGTGVGISMLLNGTCDIATASREAKKKEIDSAKDRNMMLVATKIARDGLAVIVNPSNNVKNLTMEQLKKIYLGDITNWKQVGGEDLPIVVIGRDSSSGTYVFFQETVLGGKAYRRDMLSLASNAAVQHAVIQSAGAVGYVGMGYVDPKKVKVLSISKKKGEPGMLPTEETVMSGKYPLFRYLYCYTLGKPKGIVAEFLKFATSPEGQALVKKAGYLPAK